MSFFEITGAFFSKTTRRISSSTSAQIRFYNTATRFLPKQEQESNCLE